MKVRLQRGTAAQNNALILPEGTLTVDTEKKALRQTDGATPGGFNVWCQEYQNDVTSGSGRVAIRGVQGVSCLSSNAKIGRLRYNGGTRMGPSYAVT